MALGGASSAAGGDSDTAEPSSGVVSPTPGRSGGSPIDESAGSGSPRLDPTSSDINASASGGAGNDAADGASTGNAAGAASSEGGSPASEPGVTEPASTDDVTISETCSLRVSVATTPPGGKYRPRNVGAIWIGDASGQFVKSLDVWGNRRLSHVTAWAAATRAEGVPGNKVDAVTSATLSAHRTHDVTWNCQDYAGNVMPDGAYRVYFEVTDSNSSGPNHFEPFVKGPMAASVESSATNFDGIVLTFTP